MQNFQISLPTELGEFVESQVKIGELAGASEYLCFLLRQERKRIAECKLEALLLESLEDGEEPVEMTPAEWVDIRREAMSLYEAKHAVKAS